MLYIGQIFTNAVSATSSSHSERWDSCFGISTSKTTVQDSWMQLQRSTKIGRVLSRLLWRTLQRTKTF